MPLITGHKGFIGKRLYEKIGGIGIDIKDGEDLITTDLPEGIKVVFHLASQSSVKSSWKDPVHDMDNIRMTARLVKEYPDAKIVYTASSATPTTSPYGFSKWASAEYIKNFHKNYVICVLPNVYGEEGGRSVVDIFKENEWVTIYGDGKQTRSYIHVDDIVEALIMARYWDKGVYYLGDGKATSVLDLAERKNVTFAPARKEAYEAVPPNTTPNDSWQPKIQVMHYLYEKYY